MQSLKILITAGPTQEPIDPVRYLSNYSSGKMGYALALAAKQKGHQVLLMSGPTTLPEPKEIKMIHIKTALEMHRAVIKNFRKMDVIIMVAAVADYRSAKIYKQKIKKTANTFNLRLIRNPDILKELGKRKKPAQILVGFAAETQNGLQNAKKKLKEKNCDWMVLNNVAKKGIGFGVEKNEVKLLSRTGRQFSFPRLSKEKLAQKILQTII